ncbi:MAG TPA: DUF1761 domain-containing protein [Gemmatimonadaceae bacterium]|nr:DUF1761 domain-containing protein [Gemmatimonadaceae bacterium]
MPQLDVNWIAILVAAIAAFALGALWYSNAMFGRQWMAAHGHTPEKLAAMQSSMGKTYAFSFVTYLITAMVIALLIGLTGGASLVGGIVIAVLAWLGFGFPIGLNGNLFSGKPASVFMIDAGYQLIYMIIMGAIIGAWR